MSLVNHITWDDQLAIGHPEIDAQHRTWVETANHLLSLERPSEDPVGFQDAITELVDYTAYHFATEEAFMERVGWQRLQEQRRAHAAIAANLRGLLGKEEFEDTFMADLKDLLSAWVIDHIIQEDLLLREVVDRTD